MNISKINPTVAVDAYKSTVKEVKIDKAYKAALKDDLILSEDGKIFASALKAASNETEIREDKVNEIAKRVKDGTYMVKSGEIALKIMKSASFYKSI